jgi:two-component system chemotaxis response regulator CheB
MENSFERDIVVVGGSSGALDALKFLADLPANFPAAVFLVVHAAPEGPGLLPNILRRFTKLPVAHAQHAEPVVNGRLYVAPPGYHLSMKPGMVEVSYGPRENRHRPSIDVLFRAAAETYGPRVIGVVLSGMLDDGSAGLVAIRKRGGLAVVQDPTDALYPDMPSNALASAGADHCVPVSRLGFLLNESVGTAKEDRAVHAETKAEQTGGAAINRNEHSSGTASDFSCPDCGGVLRRIEEGEKPSRFRCRVGHAFSEQSLLAAQSDKLEEALWSALRIIQEKTETARVLRQHARARNFKLALQKFDKQIIDLESDAKIIRDLLTHVESGDTEQHPGFRSWDPRFARAARNRE